MNRNIKVSISCITYNHVHYIKDALNGFLMQKTDFAYEVLIHDDASTDGTNEIIRKYEDEYPEIFKPLYEKENQWDKGRRGSVAFNFPRAQGKYIAICEGDDYWTDPYKLQKQVDFLDGNPDFGLVHTELDHYYVKSDRYVKNHWKTSGVLNQSGDLYESLLGGQGSMILACTACFNATLIQDMDISRFSKYMSGDFPLWLHLAAKTKIGYIDESTAARNVLLFSATQGQDFDYYLKFAQSSFQVFYDFNRIKPFSKEATYRFKQRYSINICNICYRFRQRFDLFQENYFALGDDSRTVMMQLKFMLFKYRISDLASRLLLKILRKFLSIRY